MRGRNYCTQVGDNFSQFSVSLSFSAKHFSEKYQGVSSLLSFAAHTSSHGLSWQTFAELCCVYDSLAFNLCCSLQTSCARLCDLGEFFMWFLRSHSLTHSWDDDDDGAVMIKVKRSRKILQECRKFGYLISCWLFCLSLSLSSLLISIIMQSANEQERGDDLISQKRLQGFRCS